MFGLGVYRKKDVELYKGLIKSNDEVIRELELEILQLKDERRLIDYIKEIKDESIIDIGNNKEGLYVLTKIESYNSLTITMKSPHTRVYPDVYATLEKELSCSKLGGICSPNKVVFIEDIHAVTKRIGNGRILIEAVISFARERQYEKIAGKLTSDDKIVTPGLPDFYRKMGFIVNEAESYFEMRL